MSLEASLRQADDCELEIVCHHGVSGTKKTFVDVFRAGVI